MQGTAREDEQGYRLFFFTFTSIYDIIGAESHVMEILQVTSSVDSEIKPLLIQLLACPIFKRL